MTWIVETTDALSSTSGAVAAWALLGGEGAAWLGDLLCAPAGGTVDVVEPLAAAATLWFGVPPWAAVDVAVGADAAHTGDTNDEWKGAYGRLWRGACGGALLTTLALPSKGGAVIHPAQDRIYTPREAARLQGFPDVFRLGVDEATAEATQDMAEGAAGKNVTAAIVPAYHAIGNAVPPPFGAALAREMQRK